MCISVLMVYQVLSRPFSHLILTAEGRQYHCANISGEETWCPAQHHTASKWRTQSSKIGGCAGSKPTWRLQSALRL